MPPPTHPLADFTPLSKTISLFTPPTFPHRTTTAPSLLILCTWIGGATPVRIAKYTTAYRLLLPHAQILLIRTTPASITLHSFAHTRALLAPARAAIRAALVAIAAAQPPTAPPPALLHIFSHGGCHSAVQLAQSLRLSATAPLALPLRAVIFDSCPGGASFRRAFDALMVGLPASRAARVLGGAVALPVLGMLAGLQAVGALAGLEELRGDLNDERVLGGREVRRLYLCSRADGVVDWREVVRHAEEGRGRGFEVEVCVFEGAAHCALVMEDGERYWERVRGVWEGAEGDEKLESSGRGDVSEGLSDTGDAEGRDGDLRNAVRSKL